MKELPAMSNKAEIDNSYHLASDYDISVIIATKGRRIEVVKLLECLERQTRPPARVLVVGTEPDDIDLDAISVVGSFQRHAWIARRPGSSSQRNEGVARLRQENLLSHRSILVFFDDDFRPASDWIVNCERIFERESNLIAMTGRVLADGIRPPTITETQADDYLNGRLPPRVHWTVGEPREVDSVYGCNMAFVGSVFFTCKFDESLPLYGWQEDRDITGQARKLGKAVLNPSCRGVHLGVSGGRTSDLRLGYSQIANIIYLRRKGTIDRRTSFKFVTRAFCGNIINTLRGRRDPSYAQRLKGNTLAIIHIVGGNSAPSRILELP